MVCPTRSLQKNLGLNSTLSHIRDRRNMSRLLLQEVDAVELQVIVNDEVDFISPSPNAAVVQPGRLMQVPLSPIQDGSRGSANKELKMSNLCCGALGLSLFIVFMRPAVTGGHKLMLSDNHKRWRQALNAL